MGLNRNRFFMIGTLLVMLGIQFRMVESFTLNEETTRALIKMRDRSAVAATGRSYGAVHAMLRESGVSMRGRGGPNRRARSA